jgi:hypothetical protein
MIEPWPTLEIEVVVGIDPSLNFMNFVDPDDLKTLQLNVNERCAITFVLHSSLLGNGWRFQDEPMTVRNDYGVNFSSYMWAEHTFEGEPAPYTKFRMVFECARYGLYEYSLHMLDRHRQKITLDPKIKNGTGEP